MRSCGGNFLLLQIKLTNNRVKRFCESFWQIWVLLKEVPLGWLLRIVQSYVLEHQLSSHSIPRSSTVGQVQLSFHPQQTLNCSSTFPFLHLRRISRKHFRFSRYRFFLFFIFPIADIIWLDSETDATEWVRRQSKPLSLRLNTQIDIPSTGILFAKENVLRKLKNVSTAQICILLQDFLEFFFRIRMSIRFSPFSSPPLGATAKCRQQISAMREANVAWIKHQVVERGGNRRNFDIKVDGFEFARQFRQIEFEGIHTLMEARSQLQRQ